MWCASVTLCSTVPQARRNHRQQFVFGRFVAPAMVGVHTACKSDFASKLKFPKLGGKVRPPHTAAHTATHTLVRPLRDGDERRVV